MKRNRSRRWFTAVALAPVLALGLYRSAYARKPVQPRVFSQIQEICRSLESITGLRFRERVPAALIGKDELRKFLVDRVDKVTKPEDLRAQELTLKMFGLVPQDYDLRQQTVDLLTEQAAAFYDYQKKKLFVLDGETGESALVALVHELSHALADQNFNLQKYIGGNGDNDDAATARMAVMEGQATWLMAAYLQVRQGGEPRVPEPVLRVLSGSIEQGAAEYPVFAREPLYIQESLVFPYKAGVLFQDAVFRKLGKQSFAAVFQRAPVSTAQIMHPDRYLAHIDPNLPDLPDTPGGKLYRKLADGALGEFDFHVLIQQYASKEEADALAPHLLGGRFALLERKSGHHPVLKFSAAWDRPDEARRFFELYERALQTKSKKFEVSSKTGSSLEGSGDYGLFRLAVMGDTVKSIEGLENPID